MTREEAVAQFERLIRDATNHRLIDHFDKETAQTMLSWSAGMVEKSLGKIAHTRGKQGHAKGGGKRFPFIPWPKG